MHATSSFAGVALPLRKIASLQNPSVLLVDNGDGTFKVDTITAFKTHSVQFKLDEELDEDTPDGRKVKVSLVPGFEACILFPKLKIPCQPNQVRCIVFCVRCVSVHDIHEQKCTWMITSHYHYHALPL